MKLDNSQKIGITESGEISFNLEAFDRLYDGNIIITKRLTDKLIEKLVEHRDKCILHLTCTGFGGSKIEPLSPKPIQSSSMLRKLIELGFPVSHVVLRIDPIVPTDTGMETAKGVLEAFKGIGVERVRISFLDMYKHVQKRFTDNGIDIPKEYYDVGDVVQFHADLDVRKQCVADLQKYATKLGYGMLEACGEPGIESISCLSQKDIDILGLTDKVELIGNKGQRKSCGCPANKTELLKVGRPHRCENACLYCFWK